MKIKRILLLCTCTFLLITQSSALIYDVVAEEKPISCSLSNFPIPKEGEVILLSDNSDYIETTGAIITEWVDKTYSIRIQDPGGSCVSSAQVKITGEYSYDATSNEILSVNLSSQLSYVPSLWTVEIQRSFHSVVGQGITYSINYSSRVDDPYSCLVGGGNWYSRATFTIKWLAIFE